MKVYKDHSNTTSKMDELLTKARHTKPALNLREVENIVKTGHYSPLASAGTKGSGLLLKGFHIGINTVIVISGIVVSSFLTFMVLKVDKQQEVLKLPIITPVLNQDNNNTPEIIVPSSELGIAPTPEPVNIKLTRLKERTKLKADKLLASVDKKFIVADRPSESFSESTLEKAAEVFENKEKPELHSRKVLSGEFMITFNYNDREIKMKLVGDDMTGLSIDDRIVAAEDYDNYSEMISEGKSYLAGNNGREQERNNLDLVRFFDDRLRADKIIADDSSYSFQLTSSQLLINKIAQGDETFSKYKKLYEAKTGKVITTGSTYRFERGKQSE